MTESITTTLQQGSVSAKIALDPAEALNIALKLHQKGVLEEAELLYRRILGVAPETLDALHYLGLLCHHQQRLDESRELIERIVDLDPSNADAHNNLGNVHESMGDNATAETCFRRAIELNPEHAPAHNNLAVVLADENRFDEAIAVYRRAVTLAPQSAEFQYNLGNALRRNGEIGQAIEAYTRATEIDQDHFSSWQGLARTLRLAGRLDEAVAVFDNLLRMNPGNSVFTYLRAACLSDSAPERAPDAYVKQIFDDAADYFDKHLAGLDYRAPQLVSEALAGLLPREEAKLAILDAGCGTGLCAPLLRPYARRLVGVDLSEGMLKKAADRKLYDDLYHWELSDFLEKGGGVYDLIVSADTLCYFGQLDKVLVNAAAALKHGGTLVFTLEDLGSDAPDFRLNHTGRYAHARKYVEKSLLDAGLAVHSFASAVLRNEGKQPVAGHLVVAVKQV